MIEILHFNQAINQTSVAPISPAKPGSMARQPNQSSTAKSRKQFRNINRLTDHRTFSSWEVPQPENSVGRCLPWVYRMSLRFFCRPDCITPEVTNHLDKLLISAQVFVVYVPWIPTPYTNRIINCSPVNLSVFQKCMWRWVSSFYINKFY